jgi:hypothetical protein
MSDSVPRSRKKPAPAPGAGKLPVASEGAWELDLLTGSATFSAWFYHRLQWPKEVKRHRLADLKTHLPAGAWEALLLAIRAHLERQIPLDVPVQVQLPGGEVQRWRIVGSAVRNERDKPVLLSGGARDISDERVPGDPDGTK